MDVVVSGRWINDYESRVQCLCAEKESIIPMKTQLIYNHFIVLGHFTYYLYVHVAFAHAIEQFIRRSR
jgi:hypothetical protein